MVDASSDAVPQILMKIQESIGALRSEIGQFRQATEARFENIERIMSKQRRDSAGMLVMMRATVTDFDERVSEVEERVAALEAGDH
ncbi:MAG TPA: hypothetical protein VIQ05_03585 [Tardiphaga sp.]